MKNLLSHTHFSIVVLLLGVLCLEGCSFYHNFIWYEPYLADENGKVIVSESNDEDSTSSQKNNYEIKDYYTKTTANIGPVFLVPFIPVPKSYRTGDLEIWVGKQEKCPVVSIDEKNVYGKVIENELLNIGLDNVFNVCHYGMLPIEQQQIYAIEYNGEVKRYLFIKNTWSLYFPLGLE